jgi:hypothetical protein
MKIRTGLKEKIKQGTNFVSKNIKLAVLKNVDLFLTRKEV